jgi:EAL domain-containing protein (putative c-di-GMP-specific phosphodiesterase class I)/GGDEF domain-containing protein
MPGATVHKQQRDKYMAFALAAADLLVEVGQDGRIVDIMGAIKALVGSSAGALSGQSLDVLFVEAEVALVRQLRIRALEVGRIEPAVLHLKSQHGESTAVTVGICCLPGHVTMYLTLSVMSASLAAKLPKRDDLTGLIGMSEFQHMAEKGISPHDPGSGAAMLREMRLVKIGGLTKGLQTLGDDRGKKLLAEIGAILNASASESSAARLGGENFGLIGLADPSANEAHLSETLRQAMLSAGLGSKAALPQVVTISLARDGLDDKKAARALAYIFGNLSKADYVAPQSLAAAFADAERDVISELAKLRDIIDHDRFQLHVQPVVELKSGQVVHYEALLRFGKYSKPFETIRFAENVGMIADLDMAICKKAIALLKAEPHLNLAVNLSGFSVQNHEFCEALTGILHDQADMAGRLLFELTESHQIENLAAASKFLGALRRRGFKVCLDDFGAGAAAYNYLRNLEVDYLKIDGAFLQRAASDKRERALLRSISVLCAELGCQTIGEMIETSEMRTLALDLGLTYGQGYLFGKPTPEVPRIQAPVANGRRLGKVATWQ